MNTIGKTLVILNFVFACVVAVILVFNVAFRAQWKEKYEALVKESKILQENFKSTTSVQGKIGEDFAGMALEIDKLKQQLKDKEDAHQAFEAAKIVELATLSNALIAKDLTTQETLKVKERLLQEIDLLNKTVKDRELVINTAQIEVKTALNSARSFEQVAKSRQEQNLALLANIQELTRKLARLETGANPDAVIIRNPSEPNPPITLVNGKIERIDGTDGTLIQVTVGSDHGVAKNNTLDVYRLSPEPKYLGMVRIVDAYPQKSVARFVYTGSAAFRPQLRVDDVVTSKINR